jgi:hypothetical protein
MREIPSLQVLCLRSVGGCSAEVTFAKNKKTGEPSTASRLLRSFHSRPVVGGVVHQPAESGASVKNKDKNPSASSSIDSIPMERTPCIGDGSARRMQANEVDLNHPMIGCKQPKNGTTSIDNDNDDDSTDAVSATLYMQHGNPALDCLQSYIDSLVELGRMDGARLGVHFFEEWRQNVMIPAGLLVTSTATAVTSKTKKRRRTMDASPVNVTNSENDNNNNNNNKALGSLSLHNCTVSTDTIEAMVESDMGAYIGVLDLTGIHGMTDAMLEQLLPKCPNLYRLSLKNCRRLTGKSLQVLAQHQAKSLTCLDIGGSFNITKDDVLDAIPNLPLLDEIHASGLDWTDATLDRLVELRAWAALSFAYSNSEHHLTQPSLRTSLVKIAPSLISLAMPFCELVMDNALLGWMGRNLPQVRFLDVRGNAALTTLTGWYDGRASVTNGLPPQRLLVLGRYSGLSEQSVEETKRVHPLDAADLIVILDGTGTGTGITRSSRNR